MTRRFFARGTWLRRVAPTVLAALVAGAVGTLPATPAHSAVPASVVARGAAAEGPLSLASAGPTPVEGGPHATGSASGGPGQVIAAPPGSARVARPAGAVQTVTAPAKPDRPATTDPAPSGLKAALSLSRSSGQIFLEVTADASRSSGGTGPLSYRFDFGDGTNDQPLQAWSPTATHVYLRAGTYTVTLTVRDATGATATATSTVTATGALRISASAATIQLGQSFTLTASGVTLPADQKQYEYHFTVVSGTLEGAHEYTAQRPTETYTPYEAGTYTWKVEVAPPYVGSVNEVTVTVVDPATAPPSATALPTSRPTDLIPLAGTSPSPANEPGGTSPTQQTAATAPPSSAEPAPSP